MAQLAISAEDLSDVSDFTLRRGSGSDVIDLLADDGSGNQVVRHTRAANGIGALVSYDPAGNTASEWEVLMLVRVFDDGTGDFGITACPLMRIHDPGGGFEGAGIGFAQGTNADSVANVTGGTLITPGDLFVSGTGFDTSTYFFIRVRFETDGSNTDMFVRYWQEGDSEPGTWSHTAADVATNGYAGQAGYAGYGIKGESSVIHIRYMAFGTAGDSAPLPSPALEDSVTEGADAADTVDAPAAAEGTPAAEAADAADSVSAAVRHAIARSEPADAGSALAAILLAGVSGSEGGSAGASADASGLVIDATVAESADAGDSYVLTRTVTPALASQVPGGTVAVVLENFLGTAYTVELDDVSVDSYVTNKTAAGFDLEMPSLIDDFVAGGAFGETPWETPLILRVTESGVPAEASLSVDPPDVDGPTHWQFDAAGVPDPSGPKDPQSVLPQGTENGDYARLLVLTGVLDDVLDNGHLSWTDPGRVMCTVYFNDEGHWSEHLFYVYPKNVTLSEPAQAADAPAGEASVSVSVADGADAADAPVGTTAIPIAVGEAASGDDLVSLMARMLAAADGAAEAAVAQSVEASASVTVADGAHSGESVAGVHQALVTVVGGGAQSGEAPDLLGALDVTLSEGGSAGDAVQLTGQFALTVEAGADADFAASVRQALSVVALEAAAGGFAVSVTQQLARSLSAGASAGDLAERDRVVEQVSVSEGASAGETSSLQALQVAAAVTEAAVADLVVYAVARSGLELAEGAEAAFTVTGSLDSERFVITGELRIENATPVIRVTSINRN
jgi:hypothetical protein